MRLEKGLLYLLSLNKELHYQQTSEGSIEVYGKQQIEDTVDNQHQETGVHRELSDGHCLHIGTTLIDCQVFHLQHRSPQRDVLQESLKTHRYAKWRPA